MNQTWQLQDISADFNKIIDHAKKYGTQIIKQNDTEFVLLTMEDYQQLLHPIYHDLDALCGTWSEQQSNEFLSLLSDFSQIDEKLWQ